MLSTGLFFIKDILLSYANMSSIRAKTKPLCIEEIVKASMGKAHYLEFRLQVKWHGKSVEEKSTNCPSLMLPLGEGKTITPKTREFLCSCCHFRNNFFSSKDAGSDITHSELQILCFTSPRFAASQTSLWAQCRKTYYKQLIPVVYGPQGVHTYKLEACEGCNLWAVCFQILLLPLAFTP